MAHLSVFRFLVILVSVSTIGFLFSCTASVKRPEPKLSDRVYHEASKAGRTAFEQGHIKTAESFYKTALKRARAMDRPDLIGNTAYNLAACMIYLEQYTIAEKYLMEADHELSSQKQLKADVTLLHARLEYLRKNHKAAADILEQMISDPLSKLSGDQMMQATLLNGHIACHTSDWIRAEEFFTSAAALSAEDPDDLILAETESLEGCIASGTRRFKAAGIAYDQRVYYLKQSRQYRSLGPALANAADAYDRAGNSALAADRYYRAARNYAAWGFNKKAQANISACIVNAEKTENKQMLKLAKRLSEQIRIGGQIFN